MSINAQNRTLPDWFTRVRTRQTVLPRFQRFEAWSHATVTQMFNTILQDLPVGAVLVLEIGDEEPFISRTIIGAPITGERITEHLLDGQQRLTGLWRGLHNNYKDRTYFLRLMSDGDMDEDTGIPYYVYSIARWKFDSDVGPRPYWANNPKQQWERRVIPLDLCMPDVNRTKRFREWAKQAIEDRDERDAITDTMNQIWEKFLTFNLPYLSLPVSTKNDTALDVFIKMNTSAAPLSTYDIVVAQVEASMGKSLHDLVADTRNACPEIAEYYALEDLTLYASALLQARPPTNSTYMNKNFGMKLFDNWEMLLSGITRTATFLENERVFDSSRLPTDVVVPVLVALWALAPEGGDGEGRARTTLRKYLWRAFFSNRYERSTNSRALIDFNELKPLVTNTGMSTPSIFDDEQYPLPKLEELITAGWPKKKDRIARAILALALKKGGLDLADASTADRGNLLKREYHHLFPVAHLRELKISNDQIYLSLNCALVTWQTNRTISYKQPERYLAERRDGTDLGETEVKERLASHLIPYDEMVAGNYNTFLIARSELIDESMKRLCTHGANLI